MGRRKYTHMEVYEPVILRMREAGKPVREIAESLGLTQKQIKNWINRYNRKTARTTTGMPPKPKGRPRKRPLSSKEEYEKEIARLQMETYCCGIFCSSQKGSEAKSKIPCDLCSPGPVPGTSDVPVL